MSQLLTTEIQRTQHAGGQGKVPRQVPAKPEAVDRVLDERHETLHATVLCDRECPYCWGPETD